MEPYYELIDHTADMGMVVRARTFQGLFVNVAKALVEIVLGKEFYKGEEVKAVHIEVDATDLVDLMVRWAGEVLYLLEGKRLIFLDAQELHVRGCFLASKVLAIPFEEEHHEIKTYLKAVTYHQAEVKHIDGLWTACLIFDV